MTHEQFRKTKKWRDFRQKMRKKHKYDYVTGSPLTKTWNLHHLNPLEYELLEDDYFACLNYETHQCLHWLWGYENQRRDWRARLSKLKELCEKMDSCINIQDRGNVA